MPITYYPDETFKMRRHVVEQLQQPNAVSSFFGSQGLGTALAAGIWSPNGWEARRISLNFSATAAKDFTVSIVHGIGVCKGKNDRLWVKAPSLPAQALIIPQGFYDGTTMAAAIKVALDASALPADSKAFTVAYDATAGTFTITPNSGTIQVLVTNKSVPVRTNSTLASALGFTVNAAYAASVSSDTAVLGIGIKMKSWSGAASSDQDYLVTDAVSMTIDNQLLIEVSSTTSSTIASYEVVYKMLDI